MVVKSIVQIFVASIVLSVWALVTLVAIDTLLLDGKHINQMLYGPIHNVKLHGYMEPSEEVRRVKDMKPGEVGYTFKYGLEKDGALSPFLTIYPVPSELNNVKVLRTENGFEMWPPQGTQEKGGASR